MVDGKVIRGKNSQSCDMMLLVSARERQDQEVRAIFSLSVTSDGVDGDWVMVNVMGLVGAQMSQFFCSGQVSVNFDWCLMQCFPSHDDVRPSSSLKTSFSSSLQLLSSMVSRRGCTIFIIEGISPDNNNI